eukprot:11411807-Heterocapsa_arctica.AAC.1
MRSWPGPTWTISPLGPGTRWSALSMWPAWSSSCAARDTGLTDNVVKSRRFGTTAEIRALLGSRAGPKVAD